MSWASVPPPGRTDRATRIPRHRAAKLESEGVRLSNIPRDRGYVVAMTRIGYFLSCEQFGPRELIDQAKRAEDAGFDALWISDHFHPWNDEQGQSPFVWGVIGALSQVTTLPVS